MNQELLTNLKEKLEKEKSLLEEELKNFATEDKNLKHNWDTRYPNRENGSLEEEADEAQEYDNLLSLEHSLELRLKDVILGLEKMAKNTYGTCEKCGKEIEEPRLLVCPEARLCIGCNK